MRQPFAWITAVTIGALAAASLPPAIAFAGFGDERFLFRGPRARTRTPPPEEEEPERPRRPPDVALTEAQARPLIQRYYEGQGQWAGQYVIDDIPRIRFVRHGQNRIHAHVRYRYRCIIPQCGGTLAVGYDQRVFYFDREAGPWRIIYMGGHMSAQME